MSKPTPEHIDIKLSRPVSINGTEVTTIRMREPLVADQLAAQKSGAPEDVELTLYSNLCGLTPIDLHKLPMRDYKQLQKAYEAFLS